MDTHLRAYHMLLQTGMLGSSTGEGKHGKVYGNELTAIWTSYNSVLVSENGNPRRKRNSTRKAMILRRLSLLVSVAESAMLSGMTEG